MADELISVTLADGKYTIREHAPYKWECLRYGEHWAAFASGPDNLHIALAHEVDRLNKLLAANNLKRRVRSLKRGTTYRVLGEAEVQISKPTLSTKGRLLTEGEKLTVYQADEDGKLWVRFPDEFEDGRFEEIA